MRIILATTADAARLLEIYAPYVINTAVSFEYEPPSVEEFAARIARITAKYPYIIAEENGTALGYAYASEFKARAAYSRCAEASIYIRADCRRRGIGSALYAELEKQLREQGILNLMAGAAHNESPDAHLTRESYEFHLSQGFRLVGVFQKCGYKFGKWYNLAYFEKHLGERSPL